MIPADRLVLRNRRFQVLGVVSLILALGFVVLTYVVIASPGQSFDHPGGFTPAGRALAVGGCILVSLVLVAFCVGSLRVVLILDGTGLVIRNPWRTTVVRWDSKPKFDVRDRQQDVRVVSPTSGSWLRGRMTYRYREVVCVVHGKQIWIAATSKMRSRERVDQTLKELRDATSRLAHRPAARSS